MTTSGNATRWDRLLALPAPALVLPPVLWLSYAALATLTQPAHGFLDNVAVELLGRSVKLAGLAALLALVLGAPFGWIVARYALRGRRLLLAASLLPLLLPTYCASLAWQLAFARQGALNAFLLRSGVLNSPIALDGCLIASAGILAFAYWPVVAWFTVFAARSVPAALEDAARLHVSDERAARWTARPALWAALPAGVLLVFLLALADFGVPNTLGVATYPVEVVNRFQLDRDPGVVARFAAPLLLLVVPLVLAQLRLLARAPLAAARGERQHPISPGRGGGWLEAACWLLVAITSLIPLGVLAAHSLPGSTYGAVWAESEDHFLNTLLIGGAASTLAVVLALGLGWAGLGRRHTVLDLGLTLPYALPASLIGVAMIRILNRAGPLDWLYTSLWGLVWTYVALFFPFAHKTLQPAWEQVDRELLDEGAVLGAGSWTQFVVVGWPVLRPYAVAGGAIVAVLASREIDASALLRVPNADTIAFRIYDYLHFAPGPNVAALSVLLVALSAVVVAGLAWWAAQEP
jgi:iron(III) transport system permease protein